MAEEDLFPYESPVEEWLRQMTAAGIDWRKAETDPEGVRAEFEAWGLGGQQAESLLAWLREGDHLTRATLAIPGWPLDLDPADTTAKV